MLLLFPSLLSWVHLWLSHGRLCIWIKSADLTSALRHQRVPCTTGGHTLRQKARGVLGEETFSLTQSQDIMLQEALCFRWLEGHLCLLLHPPSCPLQGPPSTAGLPSMRREKSPDLNLQKEKLEGTSRTT